jgi:outer membrane lipoprotein SlyB
VTAGVGKTVGELEGEVVGAGVGDFVGEVVGGGVGDLVGEVVGSAVGTVLIWSYRRPKLVKSALRLVPSISR